MKKLLLILLLIPTLTFGQKKERFITPFVMFDLVVEKGMFNGLSSNVGAMFGMDNFTQIGLSVGYRQYQPARPLFGPTYSLLSGSIFWKVRMERFLVLPSFSYSNKDYQDLTMRLGYSIDKDNDTFVHGFYSSQMGYGVGLFVMMKSL